MKRYSRKYIGEKHVTSEGYEALVIDGGSSKNYVTIRIVDWITEVNTRRSHINKLEPQWHIN